MCLHQELYCHVRSDVEMDDALQHEGSSRQREDGVDDAVDDDMDGIF